MKKLHLPVVLVVIYFIASAFTSVNEVYKIDTAASELKWTGYHLAKSYEHWGNVSIKSGTLELNEDKIIGGEFVIDMTTITNGDIEEEKDNTKLVNHLKSDDFFGVSKYPEATLKIKSATKNGEAFNITADITIRNITKEISFLASRNDSENQIVFIASFNVERTAHEVMYGWKLENAVLSGEFKMDVKIVAKK